MVHSSQAWRCPVCGYIHRKADIRDECPVCGAPGKLFEPFSDSVAEDKPVVQIWRCLVCTYLHKGESPPDNCPVCSASCKSFEPAESLEEEVLPEGNKEKVFVIGAGIAGIAAVESVRKFSGRSSEICLISKEKHLPYYRLNLTRLLAGEVKEENLPVYPDCPCNLEKHDTVQMFGCNHL